MSKTMISSTSFSLKIFTAFIGSPTYLGLPNRVVLTNPLSFTSKQGMILGRNMFSVQCEILEKTHAILVTLLGVELHAPDISAPNGRRELYAVIRARKAFPRVGT